MLYTLMVFAIEMVLRLMESEGVFDKKFVLISHMRGLFILFVINPFKMLTVESRSSEVLMVNPYIPTYIGRENELHFLPFLNASNSNLSSRSPSGIDSV